jgi:ribonuclease-3
MDPLEERIGYSFSDARIREQLVTHSSFRHEHRDQVSSDNQRLEFLGDAVLGFLVGRMLYLAYPRKEEGALTKLRARLVSASHLALKARELDLGRFLRLGRGEELRGGREKDSILADTLESLIAALYLDGGLDAASRFVEQQFGEDLRSLGSRPPLSDFKSHLQEVLHARGLGEPRYVVEGTEGPDHDRRYHVVVMVDGEPAGRGVGGSKKAAEKKAAKQAVKALKTSPEGA